MRTVAYKQAKCNPNLKGVLPDDFITEWTYLDLHPAGSFKAKDGWQFADETGFDERWKRNELLLSGFE